MDFKTILNKFNGIKKCGNQYKAICPAHNDKEASLSIKYNSVKNKTEIYCHAGCGIESIMTSVGLGLSNLYYDSNRLISRSSTRKIVDEYLYKSKNGENLFIKVRYEPKSFAQKRIIGEDTVWGLEDDDYYETFPGSKNYSKKKRDGAKYKHFSGVEPVLYNVSMLIKSIEKGEQVFIVEGEKDVENLKKIGLTATCNFDGASSDKGKSKWRAEYNEDLKGANVIIIPDNDSGGKAHAASIAKALSGITETIKLVNLPNLLEKQDVSDWLQLEGNDKVKLLELVENTPIWTSEKKIYDMNDYGNAKRLVDKFGDKIRYVNEWDQWLFFNGSYWQRDISGMLDRMAKSLIDDIKEEARNETDDNFKKVLFKFANKSGSARALKAAVDVAATEESVRISSDDLDTNPMLLNCNNGTIDLLTGEFRKCKSKDLITKHIDIVYDADAKCERWKRFISEIMQNNKELQMFLQRAIGYSLTGSVKEEKLFILHGSGANGKSKLLEVLRLLFNDYSRNIQAESLLKRENKSTANSDIARLKGARIVTAKEIEEGRKLDEALIKEATGGDMITARFLYQNEFEFMPEFKLWLATNHKPEITGSDEGIWRRIILIPFEAHFTKEAGNRDDDLLEKLKDELPGILNWCIEGCMMWQREGLNPPEEVLKSTDEYRCEMDRMKQFIDECCVLKEEAYIDNNRLLQLYNEWSGENIHPTKFGAKFKERAERLGLKKIRRNYGVFWYGIGEACKNL